MDYLRVVQQTGSAIRVTEWFRVCRDVFGHLAFGVNAMAKPESFPPIEQHHQIQCNLFHVRMRLPDRVGRIQVCIFFGFKTQLLFLWQFICDENVCFFCT